MNAMAVDTIEVLSRKKKKQKHLSRKYLCRQSELLFRLWEAHFFAANIKKRMLLNGPELHNVPSSPPRMEALFSQLAKQSSRSLSADSTIARAPT